MSQKKAMNGSGGSTRADPQGRRISRESLERTAREISEKQQWVFWNRQATLPPIGLITRAWVEPIEGGEYQLKYSGYWLDDEDTQSLLESGLLGLDLTREDVDKEIGLVLPFESGQLSFYYDPRTIDDRDAAPVLAKINKLVPIESDHYYKKAEPPSAYLWILVGFAGGQIASSLFLKQGAGSPEAAIKAGIRFYRSLAKNIAVLLGKARLEGRRPDIIWGMPIPDAETIIEGASEEAEEREIEGALERLPMLYAAARHLVVSNPPGTFTQMKFLYLPEQKIWDINYLVLKEAKRVILGARYFAGNHPLRARYEMALQEAEAEANQAAEKS